MITVVGLIRNNYRREMAQQLGPEFGPLRIHSVVDSHAALASVMATSRIDVVASGFTFAPGLPAYCRTVRSEVRPTVILASDGPSAVAEALADDHGFHAVVDLADGLRAAADAIEREYQSFRRSGASRQFSGGGEPRCTSGIHLATESDREIVGLIAAGRSDREISGLLSYSDQTIRNRVSKILQLSGLTSRTQLATTYLNILNRGQNPFIVEEPRGRHVVTARRH